MNFLIYNLQKNNNAYISYRIRKKKRKNIRAKPGLERLNLRPGPGPGPIPK